MNWEDKNVNKEDAKKVVIHQLKTKISKPTFIWSTWFINIALYISTQLF